MPGRRKSRRPSLRELVYGPPVEQYEMDRRAPSAAARGWDHTEMAFFGKDMAALHAANANGDEEE